jgi:hypothetical protein
MKNLLRGLVLAGLTVACVHAQQEKKGEGVYWPAFIALNDSESVDIVGLRFNIIEGYCENMTGLDLGFIGRNRYFNGLQLNLIRNAVEDDLAGWQVGIYNSAGQGEAAGIQTGLWNESQVFYGIEAGLVNIVDYCNGLQVGVINRAEDHRGFQVGLINVIRNSRIPFFPGINIGIY